MTHEDHLPPLCCACGATDAASYVEIGLDTYCGSCALDRIADRVEADDDATPLDDGEFAYRANLLAKAIFGEIR